MSVHVCRNHCTVLETGGAPYDYLPTASTLIHDPPRENWIATGRLLTAREVHTATLLRNGQVLVAGGVGVPFWLPKQGGYQPVVRETQLPLPFGATPLLRCVR